MENRTGSAGGKAMGAISRNAAIAQYYANPNLCAECRAVIEIGEEKVSAVRKKRFCTRRCAALFNNRSKPAQAPQARVRVSTEDRDRSRLANLAKGRAALTHEFLSHVRKSQLRHEETEANKLRSEGFEVFSPTVVCDRIAVKNGVVYFVEFKKLGQQLRDGQAAIQKLVPETYIIRYSD